jgi:hypothetical protein
MAFYLAFVSTPIQAQTKPGSDTPVTAPVSAAPKPPALDKSGANQFILDNDAISRLGVICTVYAGSPSLSALGVRLTVYSTMGTTTNCDETAFENLTQATIKAQLRAVQQPAFILRGGAHHQLMDVNLATVPNPFIRIGNLDFSVVGLVDFSIKQLLQNSNLRDSGFSSHEYIPFRLQTQVQYIWNIGKPVHRLVAPNGDRFVMYAYTKQVIKNTSRHMLSYLGPLLNLPAGWTYESFLLDKTLTIKTGVADNFSVDILFDDARNMYIKSND